MRFAAVILVALVVVSCRTKPKPAAPSVTRTEFHWPGSTAEELRDVVLGVAPGFTVAIIHDERAEVFHEMAEREVDYELGLTAASRPDQNFAISGPTAIGGTMPKLPAQISELNAVIELEREQLRAHGITTSDIMSALSDSGIDLIRDPESSRKLETAVINTPSGNQMPLRELTHLRREEQLRPLIIDRR